ncbi:MAG TPA: hypothetical protein VHV09_21345 [Trebonia sp.]|nr:hypothetical protein [Trebonia sp.]
MAVDAGGAFVLCFAGSLAVATAIGTGGAAAKGPVPLPSAGEPAAELEWSKDAQPAVIPVSRSTVARQDH